MQGRRRRSASKNSADPRRAGNSFLPLFSTRPSCIVIFCIPFLLPSCVQNTHTYTSKVQHTGCGSDLVLSNGRLCHSQTPECPPRVLSPGAPPGLQLTPLRKHGGPWGHEAPFMKGHVGRREWLRVHTSTSTRHCEAPRFPIPHSTQPFCLFPSRRTQTHTHQRRPGARTRPRPHQTRSRPPRSGFSDQTPPGVITRVRKRHTRSNKRGEQRVHQGFLRSS